MRTNMMTRILATGSIFALVFAMIAPGVRADEAPTWEVDGDGNIVVSDNNFDDGQEEGDLTVYVADEYEGDRIEVAQGDLEIKDDELVISGGYSEWDYYEVSYIYNDDDTNFAGAVVVEGADDHSVEVTAQVLPILSMELSDTSLDFGELELDELNDAGDLVVTGSTNATDGLTISVDSNGSLTNEQYDDIAYSWDDLTEYGSDGDEFYRFGLTWDNQVDFDDGNISETIDSYEIVDFDDGSVSIAETDNPVTNWSFTLQPQAAINTDTPAGNYSDELEFTITGSF